MNPKVKDAMCSSKNTYECTPKPLFNFFNGTCGPFTLDAAASYENRLCEHYIDEKSNALTQPWSGFVWCNPPYGRGLPNWVDKFVEEAGPLGSASRIVALLPSRTDTRWFQLGIMGKAAQVLFYRGRIKFSDHAQGALFPSLIAIYDLSETLRQQENGEPDTLYGQLIPIRTPPYFKAQF